MALLDSAYSLLVEVEELEVVAVAVLAEDREAGIEAVVVVLEDVEMSALLAGFVAVGLVGFVGSDKNNLVWFGEAD